MSTVHLSVMWICSRKSNLDRTWYCIFFSTGFRKRIFYFYTLLTYSQCAKGSIIRLSQRLLIYQCNVTMTVNNLCMPLQLPSAQWVCEWRNPHVRQLPALQWGWIGGGTVRAQHARVLQTTVEGDAVWSHDGGCVKPYGILAVSIRVVSLL